MTRGCGELMLLLALLARLWSARRGPAPALFSPSVVHEAAAAAFSVEVTKRRTGRANSARRVSVHAT